MQYRIAILFSLLLTFSFAQESEPVYSEPIYEFPDVEAEFPGSYSALSQFILGKIIFDSVMVDFDQIDTRVAVRFIVASNGTAHSFELENKMLTEAGKASVIKELQQMPKWIPALVEDKPVASVVMFPIRIELD